MSELGLLFRLVDRSVGRRVHDEFGARRHQDLAEARRLGEVDARTTDERQHGTVGRRTFRK